MIRKLRAHLTHALGGILVAASAFAASGCWSTDRMSTFDPKGPVAKMQFDLWLVTLYVTTVIFLFVGGLLAYAIWRYRARPTDDPKTLPPQTHGNAMIEMGTIVFSVVALVIIGIPTVRGIWMTHELPAQFQQEDILEVTVEGYQWWWAFDYPSLGIRNANELVIPKGKVVKLHLRSKDVIHSFWLPKIAGKVDLIPGRANWMWIKADEAGHYYGQCAEFCGEAHAYMLFRADVLEADDWEAWIAANQKVALPPAPGSGAVAFAEGSRRTEVAQAWSTFLVEAARQPDAYADDPVLDGARLFMTKGLCTQCHAIDGSPARGILGPNLTRVGGRRSLGAGILDHQDLDGGIDDQAQLKNLVDWISRSEDFKPGNLMWTSIRKELTPSLKRDLRRRGLSDVAIEDLHTNALSEEEFRRIALFLQALR